MSSTVLSRFTAARWMKTWQGARSLSSPASCHAFLQGSPTAPTGCDQGAASRPYTIRVVLCWRLQFMLEHTLPISWAIAFRDMLTFPASSTANPLRTVLQGVGRKPILPDVHMHQHGNYTCGQFSSEGCRRLISPSGSSMLCCAKGYDRAECETLYAERETAPLRSSSTGKHAFNLQQRTQYRCVQATAWEGLLTGLCQGLREVLGGLHNVQHALLIHAQLGRLRQRIRDGQLDRVIACMGWKISLSNIASLKDLSLHH